MVSIQFSILKNFILFNVLALVIEPIHLHNTYTGDIWLHLIFKSNGNPIIFKLMQKTIRDELMLNKDNIIFSLLANTIQLLIRTWQIGSSSSSTVFCSRSPIWRIKRKTTVSLTSSKLSFSNHNHYYYWLASLNEKWRGKSVEQTKSIDGVNW